MLRFFKHHFTRRDKKLAKLSALRVLLSALLGLLLAALIVVWQLSSDASRRNDLKDTAQQADAGQTVPPKTGKIGGPFMLINQDGKSVTDADFRGKFMIIYFGYTYCPDLCPTGLQSIAHVMDRLGNADEVVPLFITIDPARDTAKKLKEYVTEFHPTIMGLTGTAEQVAAAAKAYQVYYAKGEQVDEHDYVMDHSSLIYLMGPDGKFITTFNEEADPNAVLKALSDHGVKVPPAAAKPAQETAPADTQGGEE